MSKRKSKKSKNTTLIVFLVITFIIAIALLLYFFLWKENYGEIRENMSDEGQGKGYGEKCTDNKKCKENLICADKNDQGKGTCKCGFGGVWNGSKCLRPGSTEDGDSILSFFFLSLGPLYVDDSAFIVSNKGALNSDFTPSIQLTANDLQDIKKYHYDRKMLDNLKVTEEISRTRANTIRRLLPHQSGWNGIFKLDFEGTTNKDPGVFTIDADFIYEMGKDHGYYDNSATPRFLKDRGRGTLITKKDSSSPSNVALIKTDASWKKMSNSSKYLRLMGYHWSEMVGSALGDKNQWRGKYFNKEVLDNLGNQVDIYLTTVDDKKIVAVVEKGIEVELNVSRRANSLNSIFSSYNSGADQILETL